MRKRKCDKACTNRLLPSLPLNSLFSSQFRDLRRNPEQTEVKERRRRRKKKRNPEQTEVKERRRRKKKETQKSQPGEERKKKVKSGQKLRLGTVCGSPICV